MTEIEAQILASCKPIDVSLREKYESGIMTLRQVRERLHKAGWFNYVPSEEEALKFIYNK